MSEIISAVKERVNDTRSLENENEIFPRKISCFFLLSFFVSLVLCQSLATTPLSCSLSPESIKWMKSSQASQLLRRMWKLLNDSFQALSSVSVVCCSLTVTAKTVARSANWQMSPTWCWNRFLINYHQIIFQRLSTTMSKISWRFVK